VKEVLDSLQKQEGNPYVIVGRVPGKQLNNLQKTWNRIRTLAGLGDMRIHDLRHSFASIAAASGLGLPIIGALLGHSQTQTTARYTHLIGDPMTEAATLVNQRMAEVMAQPK
jgi:integrase